MNRLNFLRGLIAGWLWLLAGQPLILVGAEAPHFFVLITLDGVRTEELFGGLDQETYKAAAKSEAWESQETYKRFWAETPKERREKLMPFFWREWMVDHGSVIGNRRQGSQMNLRNRHRFSYPGYSEILTGTARDKLITSNDKIQNPHPTLLEFLQSEWKLPKERTGVFASWDTMEFIAEHSKGSLFINAGFQPYESIEPRVQWLSSLQFETTTPWNSVRHDAYTFAFCMDHIQRNLPRVLYLSLGETDDWAHDGRYDRVLENLERSDRYIQNLWEVYQSNPTTRDQTCFIVTTDHGRGDNPFNWMHHNDKLEGARHTWMAICSPNLEYRGEWHHHPEVYSDQIASTAARILGVDFIDQHPEAGKPISFLLD